MRYADLIKSQVVDLLTALDAEGISTVALDTLIRELNSRGNDFDKATLLDVLDGFAIVKNIKDDIVYFNSDSHSTDFAPDQAEKDDNKIDTLARKQVSKELNK